MCGCFWSKWGHLKKNLEEPRMFFRGFVWKWWGPSHDDQVYWPWLNYNIILKFFFINASIVNFKIKKRNIQIVEFLDFQNAWHEVLRNCGTLHLKFWTNSKFLSIIYEIAFSVVFKKKRKEKRKYWESLTIFWQRNCIFFLVQIQLFQHRMDVMLPSGNCWIQWPYLVFTCKVHFCQHLSAKFVLCSM